MSFDQYRSQDMNTESLLIQTAYAIESIVGLLNWITVFIPTKQVDSVTQTKIN